MIILKRQNLKSTSRQRQTGDLRMNVTKPKKLVSRSVALALGIICVILVAGIGGAMAYYTMQINNKNTKYNDYVNDHHRTDEDYNSLSTQNTNLQNQNNQLQTWLNGNRTLLNQIQTNNSNLQNQLNNLSKIINLKSSIVWVNSETVTQNPLPNNVGYVMTNWAFTANYTGYVVVNVITSATIPIYVLAFYDFHDSHGVLYDEQFTVNSLGNEGDAAFAVLPGTIGISVGNNNPPVGSTETVTITYYY
jgi:flagellar basal body-associated protein FliL